ncbi:MAG: hypothetical protein CFE23_11145 [Flavobacterium sp. BFFFF1]|uniref:tetratricopeptide repeat protein n=1 Tax=unclassified Flavobacterium TaxID=196869 RepID=UPI000BC9C53B|nr:MULTISPECIES: tetratricopeptide repeat protein [unclassified Flavobacterium]OYU80088.1 MAG: hypothetical protein CFE23_11145 [Flavobacterium sp. BFFFF1]
MKTKYVILASALLFSAGSFAQKDQLKAAEKAIKSGNTSGAEASLAEAEPLLSNDDDRAQFYFVKGNMYAKLADRGVETTKNYTLALKAFQSLSELEKKNGKSKYTKQVEAAQLIAVNGLKNDAYKDYTAKNYKESAKKYYQLYDLDKTQVDYLYNASNAGLLSKDYDLALPYLIELKKINYTGEGTSFIAVSKLSGQEEGFLTKEARNNAVTIGTHEKPKDLKIESKKPEILKNIALIEMDKGVLNDDVKTAIADAQAANPSDTSLLMNEAVLYYKNKDTETYKRIITKILEKDPNNAELVFNLGVISYNNKDYANAEKFYKRVSEINPKYKGVDFNMSALKLDNAQNLLDQMNKLGTSPADNKKYDELKKQRDAVLKESVTYLERAMEAEPTDLDIKRSLVSVYKALDMMDKAAALKATIKE